AQLMAKKFGGKVAPSNKREYGRANLLRIFDNEVLFNGVSEHSQVWMSHGDTIMQLPEPFELLSSTGSIEVAAYRSKKDVFAHPVFGLQFHPEVTHSTEGKIILENFLKNTCGCHADWTPASFVEETVQSIKKQ